MTNASAGKREKNKDGGLPCVPTGCNEGYELKDGTCVEKRADKDELSKNKGPAPVNNQDAQKIKKLQQGAEKAKEKETSTANKLLGGAAIGAGAYGASQLLQGRAEQASDAAAETDMKAYLETFRCGISGGLNNIRFGETTEIPTASAEFSELRSKYMELAQRLKSTKEALGLKPGIESEIILDSAAAGLYDNQAAGSINGTFASLSRALQNPGGEDAAALDKQKSESADRIKTGGTVAALGIAGGLVGNILINNEKGGGLGGIANITGGGAGSVESIFGGTKNTGNTAANESSFVPATLEKTGFPDFDTQRERVVSAVNKTRQIVAQVLSLMTQVNSAAVLSEDEEGAKTQVSAQVKVANDANGIIKTNSTTVEEALNQTLNVEEPKFESEATEEEKQAAINAVVEEVKKHVKNAESAANAAQNQIGIIKDALPAINNAKSAAKQKKAEENERAQEGAQKLEAAKTRIRQETARADKAREAADAALTRAQGLYTKAQEATADTFLTDDEKTVSSQLKTLLDNAKTAVEAAKTAATAASTAADTARGQEDDADAAIKAAGEAERQKSLAESEVQKVQDALERIDELKSNARTHAEQRRRQAEEALRQQKEACSKKDGYEWSDDNGDCVEKEVESEEENNDEGD
jgi:hypothetical protein